MCKCSYRSREGGSKCLFNHGYSSVLQLSPVCGSHVGALELPSLLVQPDPVRFSAALASSNNLAVDHHASNFQGSLINIHSLALKLCWRKSS